MERKENPISKTMKTPATPGGAKGSPSGSSPYTPATAIQRISQAQRALGELETYYQKNFSVERHGVYLASRVDVIRSVLSETKDDLNLVGKLYPRILNLEAQMTHIAEGLERREEHAPQPQLTMEAVRDVVRTAVRGEVSLLAAGLEDTDKQNEGVERRLLDGITKGCESITARVMDSLAARLSPLARRKIEVPGPVLETVLEGVDGCCGVRYSRGTDERQRAGSLRPECNLCGGYAAR